MALIRPAMQSEWEQAMEVVWTTFLRFEADEYTEEGVSNFWAFITDETLRKMFRMGQYRMFVAIEEGQIVGVITLRDRTHISLLFVAEEYQRQGIGRQLVNCLLQYVKYELLEAYLTVNASPYGVAFYLATGFYKLDEEQEKDGIRFTPMKRWI